MDGVPRLNDPRAQKRGWTSQRRCLHARHVARAANASVVIKVFSFRHVLRSPRRFKRRQPTLTSPDAADIFSVCSELAAARITENIKKVFEEWAIKHAIVARTIAYIHNSLYVSSYTYMQGLFLEKCFSKFSPNFSKKVFPNFSNFSKFLEKYFWKNLGKFGKTFSKNSPWFFGTTYVVHIYNKSL